MSSGCCPRGRGSGWSGRGSGQMPNQRRRRVLRLEESEGAKEQRSEESRGVGDSAERAREMRVKWQRPLSEAPPPHWPTATRATQATQNHPKPPKTTQTTTRSEGAKKKALLVAYRALLSGRRRRLLNRTPNESFSPCFFVCGTIEFAI